MLTMHEVLTVYLSGALVAAVVVLSGITRRISDTATAASPIMRGVVAVLATVLWPVLVVGALQAMAISLLVVRGRATRGNPSDGGPRTEDLMLAG